MKLLLRIGLALLALLVLLGLGVFLWFDSIVGSAIERGGSMATGTPGKVASVDASLFSGRFGLKGLELANPAGFRAEPFVAL